MLLKIGDQVFDVDPAPLQAELERQIDRFFGDPQSEFARFATPIRAVAGTVLAWIGQKYPQLRRPEGVDTLVHLARLASAAVVAQLEREPLELTVRQTEAKTG